ncbi:MAG: ABC transporter permease subunit, partial [Candidatus Scatosoma sp.]
FKKTVQTFVYLPHFISWVIFGSIVYDIFGFEGVVNNVRVAMGFPRKAFMSDSALYYPILLLFTIIKDSGWSSIIYLAAISNVSPNLYEAAEIDGCGRFRMMRNITIPCISGIITIQFLLAVGNIMNAGFDAIFNTYNVQVYDVADILDTYLYRTGFGEAGNFEMATAIGLFKSVINFILLLAANFVVKKINGTGIYDLSD